MGSLKLGNNTTCTSSSSPPPSSPWLLPTTLQPTPPPPPTTLLPPTRRRSFPPSHSPTSTEWLTTTARPTSRRQSQDGNGVVTGGFVIALPDGRIQTTTYTADHVNGFVADVTYEGTPVYPPEPKEGYGHAPACKAPAPAYKPAA